MNATKKVFQERWFREHVAIGSKDNPISTKDLVQVPRWKPMDYGWMKESCSFQKSAHIQDSLSKHLKTIQGQNLLPKGITS